MTGEIIPRDVQFEAMKQVITSPKSMEAIAMALPSHITKEKMARVVITALVRTPELLECDTVSIMQAVLEASQLGLMPDGVLGHGYILPFKDRKSGTKKATFIPGYKGLLYLARNSGDIAWVQARIVNAGDNFNYRYGGDPDITHVPARASGKEPGVMIAAYAVAKLKSGEIAFEVMYKPEIDAIRQQSRGRDAGGWANHYDEMARKTTIRRLCKYLPLSPEVQAYTAREEYADAGVIDQYVHADDDGVITVEAVVDESPLDMFTEQIEDAQTLPEYPPEYEDVPPPEYPGTPEPPPPPPEPEPAVESKGRISKEEDQVFLAALYQLREEMRKVQDDDAIEKLFEQQLRDNKVMAPEKIRSRFDREKFYKNLRAVYESWAAFSRTKPM